METERRELSPDQKAQAARLLSRSIEGLSRRPPRGPEPSGDPEVDADVEGLLSVYRLFCRLLPRIDLEAEEFAPVHAPAQPEP